MYIPYDNLLRHKRVGPLARHRHRLEGSRGVMGCNDGSRLPKITRDQDLSVSYFFTVHRVSGVFPCCWRAKYIFWPVPS